jgi:O-antigen ligase
VFALPGIILLLVFVYVRPQEFIPELRHLPLLYIFLGLSVFGLIVDYRLRRARPQGTPQLPWVILFYGWCLFTLGLKAPNQLTTATVNLGNAVMFYLLLAHAVQTFRNFRFVAALLLGITLFLSFVGVHQGFAPKGCHVLDQESGNDRAGVYDGRPCDARIDCQRGDAEPGAEYYCEHVGLFNTSSVAGGRVRYRGPLNDPNELALAVGVGLPFAFAFYERRRNAARLALLGTSLILVGACTVMTQSRGGQLVFLAVLGTYFVRRYGVRGLLLGAIAAAPILLLGGRESDEASASADERAGAWYQAVQMIRQHPIVGVGHTQFTDNYILTAHNSYLLSAAELGLPGLVLWSIVLYLSVKIPIQVLRDLRDGEDRAVARTFALALVAAWVGMLVGIFFLSFSYHHVLWILVGMSGALYACTRTHLPEWEVKLTWADLRRVLIVDGILLSALFVYTRIKGEP